jgi:integral membrane protein (TIGR01906 family)
MRLKIPLIIAQWLFALCLSCLLLTASIWWAANSHWLYTSGFTKYDVAASTDLSEAELDNVAAELIDYFNSGEEFVNIIASKDSQPFELFTEEEILHFRDVKGLFRMDFNVLLGTGIYVVGYAAVSLLWRRPRYWRGLARAALAGNIITLVLMLALWLGTIFNFDQLFLQFHLISFSNEFWSTEGYMLLLFPRDFWYDAAIYCALATAATAVILGAIAVGYLLSTRRATPGQVDSHASTENGERTDDG